MCAFSCCAVFSFFFFPLCLPSGLAFLPDSSSQSLEINADEFEWRKVTVEKYNETANKWRIKELKSGAIYEVPRIYLMLIVEKPFIFAQRIQEAVKLRSECEHRLKFDAVVDGIILLEFPKPQQHLQDNIRKLLFRPFNVGWIEIFEWEHRMLYQKTLAALELIKFLEKEPHSFPSIQLSTMEPRRKLKNLEDEKMGHETFAKSRRDFQQMWLYCCPEAIKIMEFINNECDVVSRMSLFHIQTTTGTTLMGFVDANNEKLSEISSFYKEKWIGRIVQEVKFHLRNVGKGWFDLNVSDWGIYRMSKLYRLIELIKHRMELAVRLMLRSSLQAFVNQLCQPCKSMLNVAVEFVWGNDLLTSWFHSPQPVFALELNIVNSEPAYTTKIEDFEIEVKEMFKSRILTSHEIPQIDPYLVTQLKFDKDLRLSSIGLLDDEIQNQIFHLQRSYKICLIPLRAYAKEFRKFIELKNLNISDYVQVWKESDKTSNEFKEEISFQLKSIEKIELTVPTTIVIGPFQISVSELKTDLLVKRRDLFENLLLMFSEQVKEKLQAINSEYEDILIKLLHKNETVEELLEILQWIPELPMEVKQIEKKLSKMSVDFDILESFFVVASDDFMRQKLSAQMMPRDILDKIEKTQPKHQFEFELFRKLQETQLVQFVEKIETMTADIEAYSSRREIDDVSRVANEIDEFWGVLNEMMTHGEMLNNRQKIFNQLEIDMERLTVFVKRLHPHHTFWTMASNFLRSKESWTMSPLSSVDINVIEAEVKRCENVLQESRVHFTSSPEMTVFNENILKDVEDFCKIFDVMKDLKNPDFQMEHWSELSEQTLIPIQYSPSTTFNSLVIRGIVKNAEIVKEISTKATRARKELDLQEIETERKHLEDEEIMKQKKVRRAARKDI